MAAPDPVAAADRRSWSARRSGRVSRTGTGCARRSPRWWSPARSATAVTCTCRWADGQNLFAGGRGPYGLTEPGEALLAGLLDRLPRCSPIGAPSAGQLPAAGAAALGGAYQCWGQENREAALRLVTGSVGDATAANAELKCFDGRQPVPGGRGRDRRRAGRRDPRPAAAARGDRATRLGSPRRRGRARRHPAAAVARRGGRRFRRRAPCCGPPSATPCPTRSSRSARPRPRCSPGPTRRRRGRAALGLLSGHRPGLGELPLVDHHCHGLVRDASTRPRSTRCSPRAARPPPGRRYFDTPVGMAVRRYARRCSTCRRTPRRRTTWPGGPSWARPGGRPVLRASGTAALLVDTGFRPAS